MELYAVHLGLGIYSYRGRKYLVVFPSFDAMYSCSCDDKASSRCPCLTSASFHQRRHIEASFQLLH
ncbi:hypothetical protein H5410_035219 [Solanum commersonii]|uniref:Uncharacterized protein n=1 Tax=Solanum commersonii TaxID=4109 RepID=A0A9J5Y026_SOLCO|nr:hypothetical protein H5410_035219 [Solanum commersonii]